MDAPSIIPIALVDDHNVLREALADMINASDAFRVVLQAADGAEYVKAVEAGAHVALAVVDLHMPVMDGYATIAWIREHQPRTRALALTFEKTAAAKKRALDAGACGFLLKDVDRAVFHEALSQVITTGQYDDGLELPNGSKVYEPSPSHITVQFTERELIFTQLVCGATELTYEQVAERMTVHRRTVDGYRESVFAKAGVHTKAGLVLYALRHGLVAV